MRKICRGRVVLVGQTAVVERLSALPNPLTLLYRDACLCALPCMYLLTIRDGLQTRHVGPYGSPKQAADDLDRLLPLCGERARWQIHALESPAQLMASLGAAASADVGVAA